jgi:hypothetical protein
MSVDNMDGDYGPPVFTDVIPFEIAGFTRDEMEELRAFCHVLKVRLRLNKGPWSGAGHWITVYGPHGHRTYTERDLTPLNVDTMRSAIQHGAEILE